MAKIQDTFRNIFKIHELRQRILYTVALLIIVRLGSHITLPGIDTQLLNEATKNTSANSLFGFYDLFVGGALKNAAIFALGIMPYISSSIVIADCRSSSSIFAKTSKRRRRWKKKIKPDYPLWYCAFCIFPGVGHNCNTIEYAIQ